MPADTALAPAPPRAPARSAPGPIRHDSPGFLRICAVLVLSGATAFSALYFVQPLMPVFAAEFGIGVTEAGLSLSLPTAALAAGLVVTGPVSDALGRKPVILASVLMTALLLAAMAATADWGMFLALRTALGLILGGITAINLTWLAEEMDRDSLGRAVGWVLAGNSLGGMLARLLVGTLAETTGWRLPVAALAGIALLAAALIWLWLPASRNFRPGSPAPAAALRTYLGHLRNPGLRDAVLQGFLLMSAFVAFFNLVGFHLLSPGIGLDQHAVGLVSLAFLPSTFAAVESERLARHLGTRRAALACIGLAGAGILLTLCPALPLLGIGIVLFTLGFFGAHSLCAGDVGRLAETARGQATALYQIAFYAGATLAGPGGGVAWQAGGWAGVCGVLCAMLGLAALIRARSPGA
ncbi:MFS transporter [Mangrovicoccus algicola]|uniref:MFS transporter n=1 Tax=Mangrovicoccus algicola TaxID=2771008 RepID=A0A8J7D0I5_9RHOB|nr:MFS transporter [Mangrovicoccus algicola]MBE3639493.1 MFS transporter [Mangrovicoccus algicola]